jgi:hypothetical protein
LSPGLRKILNVLCLTCLLLDSGGGLGLRLMSFAIIFGFSIMGVLENTTINKTFLLLYSFFMVSILPAVFVSLNSATPMNEIVVWVVAFILIPFLYFYVKGAQLDSSAFVTAGLIFSVIIILLFYGRFTGVPLADEINDYISSHSNGFFNQKEYTSGDTMPNVYFQGTLGLVICGCVCLEMRKYGVFVLILLALILAPSRFGFLVLGLWAGVLFIRKNPTRIILLPLVLIPLVLILSQLPFGNELMSAFTGKGDDSNIRSGHLKSISRILSEDISRLFFGQGPGSVFFSQGFNDYTDNVEMSQIEYIRKYGLFSFAAFNLMYFWPMLSKQRDSFYLKGALLTYYFVSLSNPVLFSIFSMLFFVFIFIKLEETPSAMVGNLKRLPQ